MPASAAALVPAITGTLQAEAQAGLGLYQLYKAKQIAKNNVRPEYTPNQQILQNANIAASRANTGLSDASLALATQEGQRNLSQSLNALLRSGGNGNQISDLYANNADAMLKLASLDSQLQNQNINSFLSANAAKGAEFQSAWQMNEYAPYADRAQLASSLQASGYANLGKGFQTGNNTLSNYLMANMYKPQGQNNNSGEQNFDTPYFISQPTQSNGIGHGNYNYGDVHMKPPPTYDSPSNRYIQSILRSNYDPNAAQNLDLYNKGLYDPNYNRG